MERVVVDTNVLVNFILKTELTEKAKETVKQAITEYSPLIFTNILEETTFILIREEMVYRGIKKFYEQRDFIRDMGYGDLFVYSKFFSFLREFNIPVLENRCSIDEFSEVMESYNLLPNDALIAATCKHYGIKKIATFDEDFERVDFLETVRL